MASLREALTRRLQLRVELISEAPVERALTRRIEAPPTGETCENDHFRHPRPVAVYLSRLAPSSRPVMLAALTCCARMLRHPDPLTCPWHRLTYAHTAALRAELARRYAPSTANRHLAALRGVLRECRRLGLMSADACAAAGDVDPVRGRRLPAGRALEAGEIAAVLGTCAADASPAGRRDAALIAVAYGAGLRRAEVVTLTLADYQVADASLRVRRGKGNVERLAYLGADWAQLLDAWLVVRGRRAGPIFVAVAQGRSAKSLAPSTVREIFRKRGDQAGVPRFSPHDLRRTMIGDLLDLGEDLSTVQQVAGHASPVTTARYDRRGERAKRRAAQRLRRT